MPKRLLALVVVAGVVAAGIGLAWYNDGQTKERQRDDKRRADLQLWKTNLVQQRATAGRFPPGAGEVSQSGSSGGLEVLASDLGAAGSSLPRPPQPTDRYIYSVTENGQSFVMCATLEQGNRRLAFFINADGSFHTAAPACAPGASPVTARFVTATTLTDPAAELFYENQPEIVPKATIQSACSSAVTGDIQLAGCFTGSKIYILDLQIPEILGEENVTAAHELLHAEYERLSSSERAKLRPPLEAAAKATGDAELTKHLERYQLDDKAGELHSVLGTEYPNLSPELEDYYKRFFKNRAAIVAVHQRYKSLLDGLSAEIDRLRARLDQLDKEADAYLARGNIAAYNDLVDPYNSLVQSVNQKIDRYNQLTEHTRPESVQPKVETK